MVGTLFRLAALLPLLAACAAPANEGGGNRAPAFVPANAAPPVIAEASNDLVGAVWLWAGTHRGNAPIASPEAADRYTLAFQAGGRANVRADCNRGAGPYEINGATMKLGAFALTKMMCEPSSKDREFLRDLDGVSSFNVARGQLILTLRDGNTMRFNRQP